MKQAIIVLRDLTGEEVSKLNQTIMEQGIFSKLVKMSVEDVSENPKDTGRHTY